MKPEPKYKTIQETLTKIAVKTEYGHERRPKEKMDLLKKVLDTKMSSLNCFFFVTFVCICIYIHTYLLLNYFKEIKVVWFLYLLYFFFGSFYLVLF